MKKLALALVSALLLGACGSSITASPQELRISTDQAPDTVTVVGGSGMGSGN